MNFKDFIGQNHPDPDSLINPKFDQLCKLAEEYAKSLQFLQSCVVGQSEQLTYKCDYCQDDGVMITGLNCTCDAAPNKS